MKRRSFLRIISSIAAIALAQRIALSPMSLSAQRDRESASEYAFRVREIGRCTFIGRIPNDDILKEGKLFTLERLWERLKAQGFTKSHKFIRLDENIQHPHADYIEWQFIAEDVTMYPNPERPELESEWYRACVKRFGA